MPHLTSRVAVGRDSACAHVLAAAEDLDALRLIGQVLDVGALGEETAACAHVLAAAEDLDALRLIGQVLDVGALGEETAV